MKKAAETILLYMGASHRAFENTGLEYHAGAAKAYEHAFRLIRKATQGLTPECSQQLAQLCQCPLPESGYERCLQLCHQDRRTDDHQAPALESQEVQIP